MNIPTPMASCNKRQEDKLEGVDAESVAIADAKLETTSHNFNDNKTLFLLLSLMNHDCDPNAKVVVGDDGCVSVRPVRGVRCTYLSCFCRGVRACARRGARSACI